MPGAFAHDRYGIFGRWWIGVAALALLLSLAVPVAAQTGGQDRQHQAAVNAAQSFVTRFEEADLGDVYDRELSSTFKALMARDMFVQQGGIVRVQSGGSALARELVGVQAFSQTQTGARGDYRYVRFRTRHPNGLVFQDVYLEKAGEGWKVMGFYLLPAPQQ